MTVARESIRLAWTVSCVALALVSRHAKAASADPFETYYGNTLVCVAADHANDLCHTWINRDGTFLTFDPTGMHQGHWKRGPTRQDGKTPICWYDDSTLMVLPKEVMAPMGPPPAGPGGAPAGPVGGGPPGMARAGGVLCDTVSFRPTCQRYANTDGLSEADKTRLKMTIVERFHAGMCYPLPVKHAGDTWYEDDDPLPGENGLDKLFLLKGHR